MFQGLGRLISESAEFIRDTAKSALNENGQNDALTGLPESAFRFLKVEESSLADLCGIEPFYDFLLRIDNQDFSYDPSGNALKQYISNAPREMVFELLSIKGQTTRKVTVNALSNAYSTLGVVLQFSVCQPAFEHVWHVLKIAKNSPADQAGLIPNECYIVGSPDHFLNGEYAFENLVHHNNFNILRLYVYFCNENKTKILSIKPNPKWGGQGALGCDIGYGALHRIPEVSSKAESTIFDQESEDVPHFIPADVQHRKSVHVESVQPLNQDSNDLEHAVRSVKHLQRKKHADSSILEYMNQEAEKSIELDYHSTAPLTQQNVPNKLPLQKQDQSQERQHEDHQEQESQNNATEQLKAETQTEEKHQEEKETVPQQQSELESEKEEKSQLEDQSNDISSSNDFEIVNIDDQTDSAQFPKEIQVKEAIPSSEADQEKAEMQPSIDSANIVEESNKEEEPKKHQKQKQKQETVFAESDQVEDSIKTGNNADNKQDANTSPEISTENI